MFVQKKITKIFEETNAAKVKGETYVVDYADGIFLDTFFSVHRGIEQPSLAIAPCKNPKCPVKAFHKAKLWNVDDWNAPDLPKTVYGRECSIYDAWQNGKRLYKDDKFLQKFWAIHGKPAEEATNGGSGASESPSCGKTGDHAS